MFVTEWIGWPAPKYTMAILEILVEGNWRRADDPIRYIRRAAARNAKQLARLEKYGYLKPKPIDDVTVWLPPDGLFLYRDSHRPLSSVEQRLGRELLLYRAGAYEDVNAIDRIRMMQIPRCKAATVLGWEHRLDGDLPDDTPPY